MLTRSKQVANGLVSRGGHPNGQHYHHQLHSGQLSTPVNERDYLLCRIPQPISFCESGK